MQINKIKEPAEDNNYLFICSGLVGYVLVYVMLGFCCQPSADDFDFAVKVINYGFVDSQYSWYSTWTGRYSSTAIISAFVLFFDILTQYWLVPSVLMLLTYASFYLFIYNVGVGIISKKQSAFLSLTLFALYLSGVPSPAQTFYWLSGAITYQLGNICLLVLLSILAKYLATQRFVTSYKIIAVCCTFVTVISGFNETIMLLQSFILAGISFLAFQVRHPKRFILLLILIISFIGFTIVVISPGNSLRSQYFPLAHNFSRSIYQALVFSIKDIVLWSKSFPLWAATIIVIPFASEKVIHSGLSQYFTKQSKFLIIPCIWFFMIYIVNFPAFWSMGQAPPTRTLSIAYIIFIFGWFPCLTALYLSFNKEPVRCSPALSKVLSILFLCSLFLVNNGAIAISDINTAIRYRGELKFRYKLIENVNFKNDQIINVPLLSEIPETIYFEDISGDKNDWKNISYAEYFGVKGIFKSYNSPIQMDSQ